MRQLIDVCLVLIAFALFGAAGCDGEPPAPTTRPAQETARVASLVPAVTNMLLELDQQGLLVAVSNYDTDPRVAALPRVGDLLTMDWEQIAGARPTHMIVQMSPEQTPAGAVERAKSLGVGIVHVKITRRDDVAATLHNLEGALAGEGTAKHWADEFEAGVKKASSSAPKTPVPTLLTLSPDFTFVAGRRNYLDDLLEQAGGVNVVPGTMADYPKLDQEALRSVRPARVAIILPDATDAQIAEARRTLESLKPAWGLEWEDVLLFTDAYAMVPGWSVIGLCRKLSEGLSTAALKK